MLVLRDTNFISRGNLRRTYLHPNDDSLCVKISDARYLAIRRQDREVDYYSFLRKKRIDMSYIADYYGPVNTDHGPGHLYEIIRDFDGNISKSLREVLHARPDKRVEILASFVELGKFLLENRIMFHDGLLSNTLCSLGADGTYTLKIIDGLGDTTVIPLSRIFKSHGRARVIKKWNHNAIRLLKRDFEWFSTSEFNVAIDW